MPTVSIIIPCYNQAPFIGATLQSLQRQTLSDWETIVIDDGSTDGSEKVVQAIADPRIQLICQSNSGTAAARNRGLAVAQGKYIQFLDSDDLLEPDKLKRCVAILDSTETNMVYCDHTIVREENGELVHQTLWKGVNRFVLSFRCALLTRWGIDFSIAPHAPMYRKAFIDTHAIRFEEKTRVREDWDFLLAVSQYEHHPHHIQDYVGAYYRANPSGKTSSSAKLSEGNFKYIYFKISKLAGADRVLFIFRLSEEIWMWILRELKHLSMIKPNIPQRRVMSLMAAIVLLPLAFIPVMIRSIREYIL